MRKNIIRFTAFLSIISLLTACGNSNNEKHNKDVNETEKEIVITEAAISENNSNEIEFVSDWTEGNENIYGYGSEYNNTISNTKKNSIDRYQFVTQDGWLYYSMAENGIYKMPINSTDSSQVTKLASLSDWPQNLSVMKDWIYYFYDDQLLRLRTDGMEQETVPLQNVETSYGADFYLAHDQLYYISKSPKSASEFSYTLRKLDLETMEDIQIKSDICKIIRGYKDSIYIQGENKQFERIALDGTVIAEYSIDVPGYLWDENQEICIGVIEEGNWSDTYGYILPNGEIQKDSRIDELWKSGKDHHVCQEYNTVVYIHDESIYGAEIESFESDRLNGDEAKEFYSWNDGYIYYWTRIDKIQTLCRILPDGSGWEAVNWMFP